MKTNPKIKTARQIASYLFQAKQLAAQFQDSPEKAVLIREIERVQVVLGNIRALLGDLSGYKENLPNGIPDGGHNAYHVRKS